MSRIEVGLSVCLGIMVVIVIVQAYRLRKLEVFTHDILGTPEGFDNQMQLLAVQRRLENSEWRGERGLMEFRRMIEHAIADGPIHRGSPVKIVDRIQKER